MSSYIVNHAFFDGRYRFLVLFPNGKKKWIKEESLNKSAFEKYKKRVAGDLIVVLAKKLARRGEKKGDARQLKILLRQLKPRKILVKRKNV